MSFHLHMTKKDGTEAVVDNLDTLNCAMEIACSTLRYGAKPGPYGAIDAWIINDDGKRCADLAAIKNHSGI